MSLSPKGSREVFEGNTIKRPLSIENPELKSFETVGYSSEFGGQLTQGIKAFATAESGDLVVTVETESADAGSDFIFKYELESGESGQFFYQNGLYPSDPSLFRGSAALERLSAVYRSDGTPSKNPTNYADASEFASSDFDYVEGGQKHSSEPIPRFANGNELIFPESSEFSSRNSTLILAVDWNRNLDRDFDVLNVSQGENSYLKLSNDQDSIRIDSDFCESPASFEKTSGRVVIDAQIGENEVAFSVNGGKEKVRKLTGAYSSGTPKLLAEDESLQLFDVLTYDDRIGRNRIDRVLKQLSYLYAVDLTSNGIQNHLFYDEKVNQFDMYIGTDNKTVKLETDAQSPDWNHVADSESVASNSRGEAVIGTDSNSKVYKVGHSGTPVWTYDAHEREVCAVESGIENVAYSGSKDRTVKKIDRRGNTVWSFGDHDSGVLDIANYRDVAIYSVTEDGVVRRITSTYGEEDTSGNWRYSTDIRLEFTAVEVDKNEHLYVCGSNGELRVLDNDGTEITCIAPFGSQEKISDIAVSPEGVYVVSENVLKLFDKQPKNWKNGNAEVWNAEFSGKLTSVSVSPDKLSAVSQGSEVYIIDDEGKTINTFEFDEKVNEISFQPGTFEPHWQ